MKDFDEARREREARDRTFQIGGKLIRYRPGVPPEAMLHYNRAITGEIQVTEEEWIGIYDESITALLEPEFAGVWAELRKPDLANPITVEDMNTLLQWLLAEQANRPTGQPSDSSSSSGGSENGSKAESSSPEEVSTESVSATPAT